MTQTPPFTYPEIESAVRAALETAPPTHDISHTMRVVNMCMTLGQSEGADLEILYAAALLHDISRPEADRLGRCHAEMSAGMAPAILAVAGFPEAKRDQVLHCISTHRFRGDNPPKSREAMILYDADKLDAIGAIGVCRAYAYCGENGQRLYSSFTPGQMEIPADEEPEKFTDHERHTPIHEFRQKLSRIKTRLFTESARRIAEKRHLYMLKFFNRLYEEVQGIK